MSLRPHHLRFRLDRELGSGTTGRVVHGVLTEGFGPYPAGFQVAVKYLHPHLTDDPAALASFEAEAAAGSAVVHPGLVHVLATGRDERGRFLVLPFVPGRTLRDVARESGPLPEPLVRGIARQVLGGLAALHAAGWMHGDVKPENIRLDAEGNAVLLDLGFARAAPGESLSERNGFESEERALDSNDPRRVAPRPGSLPYLAPEQAQGEPGTRASDVFALGVVLYELATGVHPFAAQAFARDEDDRRPHRLFESASPSGSSGAIARAALEKPDADRLLAAIATARFRPPSRLDPQLSPFLDRLVAELLTRDPLRRPDAAEAERRFAEQEGGEWWRSVIEFEAGARRGGTGEPDAQHQLPLVGRERELDLLLAHFERAMGRAPGARPGHVVWITGPSGSGKSRLVNELAARVRAAEEPPLYLYGRCREFDEERPCQPVLRMLERWLRLPPGVAPGARERELLEKLVPPRVAGALVAALDPADEDAPGMPVADALAAWLATLGRATPALLYLDDVKWAGEGTLSVLVQLCEKLTGARILLVLGEREEGEALSPAALATLRERIAAAKLADTVHLDPLDEEAVLQLVRTLFHHSVPRLRLASVLWQRSRGNAGLLGEIVRGLVARGEAVPHGEGGGLVLTIQPDELPLPGSLRKAIAESFKHLPTADRAWLRRLAVVGGRIETDFLLAAFPEARRAEVDQMLTRLSRSGWLVPTGARYRFARPALREAVYRSLSREQRLALHASAAKALKPPHGAPPGLDDAYQIAFHLRSAEQHEELLTLLPELMSRLLKSGQPQRVHSLATWGLAAIDRLPRDEARDRQRIVLLERAVDAADRLGFRQGQRELLDRLADLEFDPDTDPESVGRVYLLHGRYAVSTGQYGLARGLLRNAVDMFERAGRELELSESLRRLSLVQGHVGELMDARALASRALVTAQTDLQRALSCIALGIVDVLEDRFEPALANSDAALAHLKRERQRALPGAYAAAYMLRARVHRLLGATARALGAAARASHLARQAGERRLEAEATARLGGLLLDADRPDEAEARLREALLLAEEIEDRRGEALARLFLGILLWEAADPEARSMLERAGELSVDMGLNRLEAVSCAIRARIHREGADLAAAHALSARAMELLARFGAELSDRIVIEGTHALVLRTLDRAEEAAEIELALRERVERENGRLESPLARLRHSRASERLLGAVLSPEGPVYPRAAVDERRLGQA